MRFNVTRLLEGGGEAGGDTAASHWTKVGQAGLLVTCSIPLCAARVRKSVTAAKETRLSGEERAAAGAPASLLRRDDRQVFSDCGE